MDDERPRDVRDSLSELELRLLELERELRADSVRDAGAARQTVPLTRQPQPAETGTTTIEVERGSATAPPSGDEPETRVTAQQPPHFFGPPAPPPQAPAATPPPPATPSPAAAAPSQPDVGPLVDETRRKVDALRTSLDGLTGASDRLREVAQVVVEDHGRALVRLERATAQQHMRSADLTATEAQATPPARTAAAPAVPAHDAPMPHEPLTPAPHEPLTPAPYEPLTPAPHEPLTPAPAEAPGEPVSPDPEPKPEQVVEPEATEARPHWLSTVDGGRRRRGWAGVATLLLVGAAIAALLLGDRDDPATTTPTVPGSMSRIALTPELGPDTRAFASVPGTRPASDSGAVADLCDGVVGAAVVVRVSGSDPVPPCAGVVTVASGTVSALALAERRSARKRTCVKAGDVPSIAAARPDRRLTAARDRIVQTATTAAERLNRNSTLTAGERAGRAHTAAYAAGRQFDNRRGLRLLAVSSGEQGACIVPGRDDVASGRYPLSSRVELLAMKSSLDQPAVDRAAVVIGHLTSGPAPISATVLRRAR